MPLVLVGVAAKEGWHAVGGSGKEEWWRCREEQERAGKVRGKHEEKRSNYRR